ncbi:hypothetical protein COCVIDRAFT_43022 [Bipolaris victoriae FI3]|uniref:Uncharacterized protein n=1 Tax=Bipolaris victoriae (strain FI3) TaxID=930091 RepID=W7DRL9_BIPV3|nr:hypothetical protein COCVIDRAFT_43022 [Bipolaris victoriae FI3]
MKCVINFIRFFGGPIHMMMRRYRFVEEGLTLGRPDTKNVIAQTRRNVKLWNRLHEREGIKEQRLEHGLAAMLEKANQTLCSECEYRESYGVPQDHTFGGVSLCAGCQLEWSEYIENVLERMVEAFPETAEPIHTSEMRATSFVTQ